jgi:hypothetical protein
LGKYKENQDYTECEKQMMVSLIFDYLIFGATDIEMITLLSEKFAKENDKAKIPQGIFYQLKKEAMTKKEDPDQWIDNFEKYHMTKHYKKRIEEVEYIQRTILMILDEELKRENPNTLLIKRLGKRVLQSSKILAEYGMAPPIINKLRNLMELNIHNMTNNKDRRPILDNPN